MAENQPDIARILTVPSEEAMQHFLDGLNVSGVNPEVPCAAVGKHGSGTFLATLTDPDADHVNYVYSDEGGRSRCVVGCDNCGSDGPQDEWEPTYPVLALVTEWPHADRLIENDFICPWWVPVEPSARRYCKTCDFYTDHVSTAHDGLAGRGLLRPSTPPATSGGDLDA